MLIVGSTIGARAVAPLGTLISQWRSAMAAKQAFRRLDELLAQHPLQPQGMALPAPTGLLTVESLVAAAPKSNAPILRGLQFKVKPGQMLAVVGPSGSGKSTLAKLLVGLWPALSGKVRLDSADVFKWHKSELGPHIGYVPQTVELYEGTLADNIARFEEGASPAERMQRVQEAAQASGLAEILRQLPDMFESRLGPEGHALSGGQMQRVAIARAIYGNPKLLVLDEPNSHLDTQGEADLARLITAQKNQGTTVVVVTHRKNLLALAEHILVLAEGAQQFYGAKDEVMAKLGGGS
jgi:ATP-binding cassette subfamily C exporter for protease/lipase